jgi:hypothetical protein
MPQRRSKDTFGFDRERRVGVDPCGTHERVGQFDGGCTIARVLRDAHSTGIDERSQPIARRRPSP